MSEDILLIQYRRLWLFRRQFFAGHFRDQSLRTEPTRQAALHDVIVTHITPSYIEHNIYARGFGDMDRPVRERSFTTPVRLAITVEVTVPLDFY